MTIRPLLQKSEWPRWPSSATGQPADPQGWHLRSACAWLRLAAAEPRLLLVLCSGPAGKARFIQGVIEAGLEAVEATARHDRPIHPALAAHQGDHFNNLVFVVDGAEADPPGVLAALAARVSVFERTATWGALVIESLPALAALDRLPTLTGRIMRSCLVLESDDLGDGVGADGRADRATVAGWRAHQQVDRLIYRCALTPDLQPRYADYSRLARAGYAPLASRATRLHLERERLRQLHRLAGEAAPGPLPFDPDQAGPAVAEAALRHLDTERLGSPVTERLWRRLTDDAARLACGAPVQTELYELLSRLQANPGGEARALATRSRSLVGATQLDERVLIELGLAAALSADGDLPGVSTALARARRIIADAPGPLEGGCGVPQATAGFALRSGIAPELAFEVLEKLARVHAFNRQPGQARRALDDLLALAPALHAPHYQGRVALALGEHAAPLDASGARRHLAEAAALFDAHGYPGWSAIAAAVLPQARPRAPNR